MPASGRLGGLLLDDTHGLRNPTKADYWFPEDNVVGELKCLSDNYFDDCSFSEWLNRQYQDWVYRNLAPPIVGRTIVNLARLPSTCAHEVTSFLRKRLDGSLKQANTQIKQSRLELGAESALGLLILVNNGNVALPPEMARNIVARSLPNKFFGINSIIHFTANMPGDLERIDKHILFLARLERKKYSARCSPGSH
ncbi:hypothetical protein K4L06_14910 [Lysobacter sp. BMK333-48F3]|uniref:hypothetical protein n=1 Tax=Lysobacter sp. BMK333-48F3 TaxID=2867962 RepID=UPI001C8CD4FD|nr:hypothetical protein [Lysobacter sp. BMK333-48F3]MBX9402598.1 hypothetical protein [Lysobacter sp. BMK333-48F3]